MDYAVIRKKLNTFRTKPNGCFKKVSGELLVEILRLWEGYTGPMKEFARQIGVRGSQLGPMIFKARRLVKNMEAEGGDFKEIRIESSAGDGSGIAGGIELSWEGGKVIRFSRVEQLVEFLKKVA